MSDLITRKRMLYKSKVEYMSGDGIYTMNHALGCSHGCGYPCYAYSAAARRKQVSGMDEWRDPKIVDNTLELLTRELEVKRKEPIRRVHLCFTTDPFMYGHPEIKDLTLKCIELINAHGIPVTTLTKGLYDIDFYETPELLNGHELNEYGITLCASHDTFREQWEPGASNLRERVMSLYRLSRHDLNTWVSMEPFPALTLQGLLELYGHADTAGAVPIFVEAQGLDEFPHDRYNHLRECLSAVFWTNRIVFGRWNYNREMPIDVPDVDEWYRCAADLVSRFCAENNIECIIKKGTVVS